MNYILIFPDEMRAESLHCYGNPVVNTPNMDSLAAEGTMFTKTYTAHPVCVASRCALVTGWYPHVHGYRSLKHYLGEKEPNFVSGLKNAGFITCFDGKSDCFTREGTEAAFTELNPSIQWQYQDIHRLSELYKKMQNDPPKPLLKNYLMISPPTPDGQVTHMGDDGGIFNWACGRIVEHSKGEKPFFMMLCPGNPHPPYEIYERYYNMYDPDKLPPLRQLRWLEGKPELYKLIRQYRELGETDEQIFKKMNAIYLGKITYVDELIGRLIETLKTNGIYDNTTIIICSDHGDFAGDAGLPEKWPSAMDDMLSRVPLIIHRPGCQGNQVVDTPTQVFDIFPTIFDFENIEIKHPQFGVSLKPQVYGEPGDASRTVYCEGGYDISEPHCFEGTPLFSMHLLPGWIYYPKMLQQQKDPGSVCRVIMQRDNRYKLNIRTNGENELYDMDKDPLEYNNLYYLPENHQLVEQLTNKMLTWLIHTSDVTPYEGHVLPGD